MMAIKKAAIFFLLIGDDKGRKVISLMDDAEIKQLVPAMRELKTIAPAQQRQVWQDFVDLGYETSMNAADTLTVVRFLLSRNRKWE